MSVALVFQDAQGTVHTSLIARMRLLEQVNDFQDQFIGCTLRLLSTPKSHDGSCGRVIKFVAAYLSTSSAFLITPLLSTLLPQLTSRDKTARIRSAQLISNILNSIPSIDDDLYLQLRHELLKRLHDKVPAVRAEIVTAVTQLLDSEIGNDESQDIIKVLSSVLRNDTNALVRRRLLSQLPIIPSTLPYILERARDSDDSVRRTVYTRILPQLADFRHLSVAMRDKILRWGLKDADVKVRKAAASLFSEQWIEHCALNQASPQTAPTAAKNRSVPSMSALSELLERIDVINCDIAPEAMAQFWQLRPDYLDSMDIDWGQLTPESALIIRTFCDYCSRNPIHHDLREDKMPEVSQFGFCLQEQLNNLLQSITLSTGDGEESESLAENIFIVEQLLHITQTFDYGDETGRRRMFSLLRESIAIVELPEEITTLMIEALKLVTDKGQFSSIILEAIADVHDSSNDTTKCLEMAAAMLTNVSAEDLPSNVLSTTVDSLIVPAVKSQGSTRVLGLRCLALCCLIDKDLAETNLQLFEYCASNATGVLQDMAIQALSDMSLVHQITVEFPQAADQPIISRCIAKTMAFGTLPTAVAV